MLFYSGLLPSTSSISQYPQKTLRICANPMTQHGRGRVGMHVPTAHSWLYVVYNCCCCIGYVTNFRWSNSGVHTVGCTNEDKKLSEQKLLPITNKACKVMSIFLLLPFFGKSRFVCVIFMRLEPDRFEVWSLYIGLRTYAKRGIC